MTAEEDLEKRLSKFDGVKKTWLVNFRIKLVYRKFLRDYGVDPNSVKQLMEEEEK